MTLSLQTQEYEIHAAFDLPASSDPVYAWGNDPKVPLLITQENGQRWLGQFEAGGLGTGWTDMVRTPSPFHCCVVLDGRAYVVDVRQPASTLQIPGDSIAEINNDAGDVVTLLMSPIDIVGICADGGYWRSERVASDQIRGISVSWPFVVGEGWMAYNDSWVKFRLDARTGMKAEQMKE